MIENSTLVKLNDLETLNDSNYYYFRNSIGKFPHRWFNYESNAGFDHSGRKLLRLRNSFDLKTFPLKSQKFYVELDGKVITLTKNEIKPSLRIRKGKYPRMKVSSDRSFMDLFSSDVEDMSLHAFFNPKRKLLPSIWERKKIIALTRFSRNNRVERKGIKSKQTEVNLIWGKDHSNALKKIVTGFDDKTPPTFKLPDHQQSYNPPMKPVSNTCMDTDQTSNLYDSLRQVPCYDRYIYACCKRCHDQLNCARRKEVQLNIDTKDLLNLPEKKEIESYPKTLCVTYSGHREMIQSICLDPTGQYIASGSKDGTIKQWEVHTGRCMHTWDFKSPINHLAWCPSTSRCLMAACVGKELLLFNPIPDYEETATTLWRNLKTKIIFGHDVITKSLGMVIHWGHSSLVPESLMISHKHTVKYVAWHRHGEYLASVASKNQSQSVLVHQLANRSSQNMVYKTKGKVIGVLFHDINPFLSVASQREIRVYNLVNQELLFNLPSDNGFITSFAIHPLNDYLVSVHSDNRIRWYDLGLRTEPCIVMQHHSATVRAVAFHRSKPLFASVSDDGTCQVFHYSNCQTTTTRISLVPVASLLGHDLVNAQGVTSCIFHPTQPWVFTAGVDGYCNLYCD